MKTINVLVRDKIATAVGDIVYICGNSDYIINFDFDAEWDAYGVKTARFVHNGTYTDVVFTGNQCAMPVIHKAYGIYVGVYAGDLRTTTPAHIPSAASILSAEGTPAAPPDDVYAQITALCEDALATANSVRNDADTGKFNGAPGKTPVVGEDYFTEADKQAIAANAAEAVGFPQPAAPDNGKYLGCENGAATWMPVDASGGGDISLGLTAASVGQTIKVKAVDENGKPTEWEAAKEKTLKWIKVHSSTLTEEATSFSVSADENGKSIADYNPLGIAVALYIPADSTQAANNGQLWVYPQSKIGDNEIRTIGTISGWKTVSRDAGWMWQGGDILGLTGYNIGLAPVYKFSNYVMNGVYLLVHGNGNHLPVGTKVVVTILCEM